MEDIDTREEGWENFLGMFSKGVGYKGANIGHVNELYT